MDHSILPQKPRRCNPTAAVTLSFDQEQYPVTLTPTEAAIVAFARQ